MPLAWRLPAAVILLFAIGCGAAPPRGAAPATSRPAPPAVTPPAPKPDPVKPRPVVAPPATPAPLTLSGTLAPRETVEVSSVISGRVVEVLVDFNSVVKKGQVLAKLEPPSRSKRDRQNAIILAPIDGIVLARHVDVGQVVVVGSPPAPLFTLASDLSKLEIDAVIAQADVARVAAGMPARFTVDAYPGQQFVAMVRRIGLQGRPDFDVVLDVDNSELKLRPGMTANVSFP